MELDLDRDQELLRDTAARFIDDTCPLPVVRRLLDSETGLPAGYLHAAARLGWFAMLVPEAYGGGNVSGEGLRDAAIIAEERGRGLQPGPFTSMNVVAGALAEAGTTAQKAAVLPALCRGDAVATWVVGDPVARWAPGATVTATSCADGFELSGGAGLVQDGVLADWFLVTAGGTEGLGQFLVAADTPGLAVGPLAGHDITQRLATVAFHQVRVPPASRVGDPGSAEAEVERQLRVACVLCTAETVGAMDRLFEMTRQYALDRTAFGRPIGSFQAVKHQLADLSLSLEAGKAIAAAAVRAVQADDEDAGEIASMAKSWMGDAGIDLAQGCFQVFGGIGYTWEHDLHLFLRRMTMNGLLFGQSDWHRERICRIHGL
ncbi:MAG: acyl-CoA dehydrogenase family protein [Acidimicrobiales bacterium]